VGGPTLWPRRARAVALFLSLTVLAFWLLEGLSSFIWVSSRVAGSRLTAERLHTRYDPELGWVSVPNMTLQDLYGPGVGLTTNTHGFRGPLEVGALGPDMQRVVCSGDSFTLGYGVDDLETWCHQLGSLDRRLDTVNMGQGGYGVDQAYLWYKRDGRGLDHQVQVFALIADDLLRMMKSDFHGFGKPHLDLDDGRLVTRNVPVPAGAYRFPLLTANRSRLQELRSYALLDRLFRELRPPEPPPSSEHLFALFFAVLEDLRAMNAERGSSLLVVYLPTFLECLPGSDNGLRVRLATECATRGLTFVDLTFAFAALPPDALDQMYLPGWPPSRHFSARGHLLVAQALQPRISAALPGPGGS
jgi:hypothetical protein